MIVTLTGAAGFIGSRLAHALLDRGDQVRGIDRFAEVPYPSAEKRRNARELCARTGFDLSELDLAGGLPPSLVDGADAVVNLAGLGGLSASWAHFPQYLSSNAGAAFEIASAAMRAGCRRVVHASTSSVYGRYAVGDEALPPDPASPYGISKLAGEQCFRLLFGTDSALVILRLFSIYGAHQRSDMGLYKMIDSALHGTPFPMYGDGSQTRGITHVSDCVNAFLLALDGAASGTYNVGGDEAYQLRSLIDEVARTTGSELQVTSVPVPPGDQVNTLADTTRVRSAFGWAPTVELAEGVADQVAWQAALVGAA